MIPNTCHACGRECSPDADCPHCGFRTLEYILHGKVALLEGAIRGWRVENGLLHRLLARAEGGLRVLQTGPCWCCAGIDNPMMAGNHSDTCKAIAALVDDIAKGRAPLKGD